MKLLLSLQCVAHRGDIFVIEYLDEIETEFEKYLSLFIKGLSGGLESWKKSGGQKSRDTLPLQN